MSISSFFKGGVRSNLAEASRKIGSLLEIFVELGEVEFFPEEHLKVSRGRSSL